MKSNIIANSTVTFQSIKNNDTQTFLAHLQVYLDQMEGTSNVSVDHDAKELIVSHVDLVGHIINGLPEEVAYTLHLTDKGYVGTVINKGITKTKKGIQSNFELIPDFPVSTLNTNITIKDDIHDKPI